MVARNILRKHRYSEGSGNTYCACRVLGAGDTEDNHKGDDRIVPHGVSGVRLGGENFG